MHPAAYQFVQDASRGFANDSLHVLEFGSYNVNGSVRPLFPNAQWVGVDLRPGPCVDIVADAATFSFPGRFDLVICCEAFEHTENWREIVANAARLLKPGGRFIGTAAGPLRAPHGCNGGPFDPASGETYGNIEPGALRSTLKDYFPVVDVDVLADDVRWLATKGDEGEWRCVGCGRWWDEGDRVTGEEAKDSECPECL